MSSGRDSLGRGQHSSNWVSGISTRTIHQSTTPSLSQTIWPRWVSRQFLSLPIVQTLLLVTFAYSLSSEAVVVMRQLRRWNRLWRRSLTRSHKRTSTGPSRSCWNGTIGALQPEENTSKGTRVSIKVPTRKMSGNLFNDHRIQLKIEKPNHYTCVRSRFNVTVAGNGRGDSSYNLACIPHSANNLWKSMNPIVLLPAMGK